MNENRESVEQEEGFYDGEDEEDSQKDKYLTFHLAKEDYGVEIKYVTEIIGIQKITEIPDMPYFVKGIINLRGKIIPVIDVRTRFKIDSRGYDDRTCIIVVNIDNTSVGLVVDEVSEVANIPEGQVEPPPKTSRIARGRFIKGIGKMGEEVRIILNVSKLLQDEEMDMIKDTSKESDDADAKSKSG
jgi:purine-binding chemotaxis protein CheW